MQTCTNCGAQSPDSATHCVNCEADLSEVSGTSVARKRYQANSRVKYIRIIVNQDCCPACRELEGAYPKDEVPHLPAEGCSHRLGCRCSYQPFLTEIYP